MPGKTLLIASSAAIYALTLVAAVAQSLPDLALPSNITVSIQSPGPSVPAAYAGFVGKWGGYWDLTLPSNLYVETASDDGVASVVYAWGTNQNVRTPGAVKVRAKIQNGVLTWGDPVNAIGFEFKLQADGKLGGERYNKGAQQGVVTMSKM